MFLFNDRWAAFLFFFFMGDVTQKSTNREKAADQQHTKSECHQINGTKKKTIVCASQTTFLFLLSGSVFRLTESRLNKSNRASDWFWQNENQLSYYHKEGSEYNWFFDPIYRHTVTVNRTNRSGRRHNFSFASCSFPRCDQMKDFCFWWSPEVVKCAGRFFLHLKKGKLWKNKHVVPWKDWSLL